MNGEKDSRLNKLKEALVGDLKPVTKELIEEYVEKFRRDERYGPAEIAISELISRFPKNDDFSEILYKACVINTLYSAQVKNKNIVAVSEIIKSLNIDDALKRGDISIVVTIREKLKEGKLDDSYSFVTKYCSWHNQEAFPIYDKIVRDMLCDYQRKDGFSNASFNFGDDLKVIGYREFKNIIEEFISSYKLHGYNFKLIDMFLYWYGKERYNPKEAADLID